MLVPGMDVRIGITPDGRSAGFNTYSDLPLLLVGDAGRGKTTIARYLTRWWLADITRHAHVYAPVTIEWADLRCERLPVEDVVDLVDPVGRDGRPEDCLIVVDGIDTLCENQLALAAPGAPHVIWTSHGDLSLTTRLRAAGALRCLGLVRREHADAAEAAVLEGQGRLDWPIGTIAVIPDQRGLMDFPRHRWQASVPTNSTYTCWRAVAR
ncbi:uncharacterized protein PD653_1082 [Nocardioides sp. PD653]|nr:uncharacterized protein PD653B2_0329 [Nocardioides sp. PD653-B2]GAW53679.1 uncharacterized protein PD653_1082 [Nocardioides sp. PD653]